MHALKNMIYHARRMVIRPEHTLRGVASFSFPSFRTVLFRFVCICFSCVVVVSSRAHVRFLFYIP